MTNRLSTLVILCLCATNIVQAQYSYRHYTLRDGLAQGSSYYIMQDSRRFLWLSVQGGLNRFDGNSFVFYPSGKKGLQGAFISGLVEAPNGDLWLGTEEGLNRYNRRTDSFTAIRTNGQKAAAVHVFDADSQFVWYLSDRLGLVRYNYKTNQQTVLLPGLQTDRGFENDYVFHDRSAHLIWMLMPQGLMAVDYVTHRQRRYFTDHPTDLMPRRLTFSAMRWDATRHLFWLACAEGIVDFSPDKLRFTISKSPVDLSAYPAYDIHIDARQQLWINTGGAGILVFDSYRRQVTEQLRHQPQNPQSLAIDEVGRLYIDREGNIWANADPLGLDLITPDQAGIRTYTANPYERYPLVTNAVRGMAEAPDGTVWSGSISGGAVRIDPRTGRVRQYVADGKPGSLPGGTISGFCVDKQGRTWLATRQGLADYVASTQRFRLHKPTDADPQACLVRGIFAESDKSLLVATHAGLLRYVIDKQLFTQVGQPGGRLMGTFWHDSAHHRLYVGKWLAGFDVYDYRNGQLRWLYNEPLNGQNALCFQYDSARSVLWIGSSDLLMYDPIGQRVIRRIPLGDEVRPVYAFVHDELGNWWIPTNRGLYQYDPVTSVARLFRATRPQEYNSMSTLKTREGLLFFGGNEGIVCIDPRRLSTRRAPFSVVFSAVLINDRPVALAANELDTIRLPANQRTLTVHYGVVDFISEGKNHYQYRLQGYDPAWIEAGSSTVARYANLPPGTYTFDVKAAAADGRWTPQPRRLTVLVATPFWQKTWFLVAACLFCGLLLYGAFRWLLAPRLHRQRQRFGLMLQSQQQERTRLARELHDHIGPDLAVLKLKLELAAEEAVLPFEATQLTNFSVDLSHILVDLRNVSHALLPAELQAHSLVDSLDTFIRQLASMPDHPEINFTHNITGDIPQLLQQSVYQITKELIYNALKHADASIIDVELNQENGSLHLVVTDDGRGYDPTIARQQSGGIGLRNLQDTVSTLNGELIIHPRPSRGTVHRIRLPA